ncbi:MAG: vWA domain-containing protein [Planctomycetota bacterium]
MFARPWLLLLLALPVIHLYWVWARRSGRFSMPFDSDGSRRLGSGWLMRGLLGIGESLPALLFAVAILLIALPQELAAPKKKRALTNIQFLVDISGSMSAKFGEGNRFDASMKAIDEFLSFREGDSFGLTFFGNNYLHWSPLTSDPSALRNALPFMGPGNAPPGFGGTEIGKAVLGAREVLTSRPDGDRMMILVTDGDSPDLEGGAAMQIAKRLRADEIRLFAINIQDREAKAPLVNLARTSGGEVWNPGDRSALANVFAEIDKMNKAKIEQGTAELVDWFFPFCVAGLSVLGAFVLFLLGWRHTPW